MCPPSATLELSWTQPDPIVGAGLAIGCFAGLAWVFFFPPDPAKSYWDERSLGKIIIVTCMFFGVVIGTAAKLILQSVC